MQIGYARVSTQEQNLSLQRDALRVANCERVFIETASGAQRDRPELRAALKYMREGDVLVVWKLDRLARSLKQLIETVEDLGCRGIGLRSLTGLRHFCGLKKPQTYTQQLFYLDLIVFSIYLGFSHFLRFDVYSLP